MAKVEATEIWKPVVGWENLYSVSNFGRVRGDTRWKTPRIRNPCVDNQGYCRVSLWHNGRGKMCLVHRLVAAAFIGPCPDKHEVNHIDGNPSNNNAENLEYVTRSQNHLHARHVLGTITQNPPLKRGEENGFSKLTEPKVREIVDKLGKGQTGVSIAKEYDVSPSTISLINRKKIWRHVL